MLIFAAITTVVASVLVTIWACQSHPFGASAGPTLSPGKVAPQLVQAGKLSVLLAPDGSLWCWGTGESFSSFLVEDPTELPQRIGSEADWCQVAANYSHALALKTNGSLWSWTRIGLGMATPAGSEQPVTEAARIGTSSNWVQIAAGVAHYLALQRDGTLWAWGHNLYGQVGDGSTNTQPAAIRVGATQNWRAIAAGSASSFALKQDGTLWGWGSLILPRSDDQSPRQMDGGSNVVAISASDSILLAIKSDGTLWISGPNAPATAPAYVKASTRRLVQIGKDKDWSGIYAGTRFFLARKQAGSWWVCGSIGGRGKLAGLVAAPRRLPFSFKPSTLSAGSGDALVLNQDGGLWRLSLGPDTSKFAARLKALKAKLNLILGRLPGHPQPLDPNGFLIHPAAQKIWQFPPPAQAE